MSAMALAARSESRVASAAPNASAVRRNPSGRLRNTLFICTCCGPSAWPGYSQRHQPAMTSSSRSVGASLSNASGSKAKSNGAMLKAGSDIDLTDETNLKPGKSDQNSASREKFANNGKTGDTMTACIVGWAHSPFGRLGGETVESLIVRVAGDALADAAIAAKDVDEIVLGHFNAGFSPQDFTASLVLQASPDLRFKRATRVENACSTGSAAVHQGLKAIAAGSARIVLVVGVEQMTTTPSAEIGRNLLKASYVREEADIDGGFAGIFGKIAALYFQRWGDQLDA